MSVLLAERFQGRLEGLSDQLARRLTLMWASMATRPDAEVAWLQVARPLISAAASQSVMLSTAYATTTLPGVALAPVSPLIVPDAVAHVWDPMGAVWRRLGDGVEWPEAIEASADDVLALADDVTLGTGREAVADQLVEVRTGWRRRLNAGACKWCMSMSKYTWPAAHEATFGHARCRCVAVPADDLGEHNDQLLDAAGWDQQAERQYKRRHQITRLKESEQNAMKRSREAAEELRSERDPARRERLSMREQDWETRAERAAEKRRILETGSHRLAA